MTTFYDVTEALSLAEQNSAGLGKDAWKYWLAVAGVRALLLIAFILGEVIKDNR